MGVILDERFQEEAYEEMNKKLKETGKAGLVAPTGTGKTYIALKYIEDNLDKGPILYIAPTARILVRVKKLIEENYTKEEAKKLLSKIKFTTYNALYNQHKSGVKNINENKYGAIILDEVHRSGASEYGKAVDHLLETNTTAEVIGMTATPTRSDGRNMIEERCGETAYELTISEAVARGILQLPIYITSRYIFEDDITNVEERIKEIPDESERKELEEKLKKIKKQLENAKGLKEIFNKHITKENSKIFAFCNPGDNIEEIIEKAQKEGWFDEINKDQTMIRLESSMPEREQIIALEEFERKSENKLRIMFSKNMLNEGIRDEKATTEIMLRPTKSYILFTQQLGRVLSMANEEPSTILDLVNNIYYFKEFRDEIQEIIRKGKERGDVRYNEKVLEQFRIIEEEEDFIKVFKEIEERLNQSTIAKALRICKILYDNGVNLTEIPIYSGKKNANDKREFTFLKEIKQEGIDIGKIIEGNGLDGNYRIGKAITDVRQAYNGNGSYKITEKDKNMAEMLGLISEEKKSVISEVLKICKILYDNGVDLSKIILTRRENGKRKYTLLEEIKQEGIDIGKIIEGNGLDGNYRIGKAITVIKQAYKGNITYKITEIDKDMAEELGLIPKEQEETEIEELLRIGQILQNSGCDVSKIKLNKSKNKKERKTLLKEVEQEGIDIERIIEENGLDGNYPIGQQITQLRRPGYGKFKDIISEEQKKQARKIGLIPGEKETSIARLLRICKILYDNGVNLSKIQICSGKNENDKKEYTLLKEIKPEGINIERIIEENGLDGKYEIGNKIRYLRQEYKKKESNRITEEEREIATKLGLITLQDKEEKFKNIKTKADATEKLLKQYEEMIIEDKKINNKQPTDI